MAAYTFSRTARSGDAQGERWLVGRDHLSAPTVDQRANAASELQEMQWTKWLIPVNLHSDARRP
jgi:hypothetical protein